MTPRATYRLQLYKDFGFDRAAALAPYLARLGVSHLYASPYLKARPGSTHGYDIVDHAALNPELGGQGAFARMNAALAAQGLKQILDFVPNHMGVAGADNPFWLDTLEFGPDSAHAGWFDIDWGSDRRNPHKLLVPFLGDQYGEVLESGALRLKFDAEGGSFAVWAYDAHKLPICPADYGTILGDDNPELARIGDSFSALGEWLPHIERRAADLKQDLATRVAEHAGIGHAIEKAMARFAGETGHLESWARLDALIRRQYWRVAYFRVAADDINYRRFFNINDLAGIRIELPEVFEHAHRLVLGWMREGLLDGLRIDHVDGLYDPKAYLRHLRAEMTDGTTLLVEKILASHETLREDWPVEGTTGYDFTNQVLGVLVDPAGEAAFTRIYADFTGATNSFASVVRLSKERIMESEMAAELNRLAGDICRVACENPKTADFTRNVLHRALAEIVAAFPVYRTYVDDAGKPSPEDRRDLDWALAQARRSRTDIDPSVFDFLAALLSGDLVASPKSGFTRHAVLSAAMKFQQYSGPVMAKGLEDTAFYRYNRFVALNEVGGRPEQFGTSLSAFHKASQHRAQHWPHAMLTTATHDTKRGEDVRARLAVLSEIPDEWARHVEMWSRLLRARRGDVEGIAPPDRNDEYLFYQLLVGSWPPELLAPEGRSADALSAYGERLAQALVKSMREGKLRSNWAAPDQVYEKAMLDFAKSALETDGAAAFLASFLPFVEKVARLGVANSIVQCVLKLSSPGFPDLYQGSELWDLSLVDPDNRRPVDYALREKLLSEVEAALATDRADAMARYFRDWADGRIKLAVTLTLLRFRQAHPDLFSDGLYEPIGAQGEHADDICAFLRRHGEAVLLVAVARFPARRDGEPTPRIASLKIPGAHQGGRWTDILTGRALATGEDGFTAANLFSVLPAAILVPSGLI